MNDVKSNLLKQGIKQHPKTSLLKDVLRLGNSKYHQVVCYSTYNIFYLPDETQKSPRSDGNQSRLGLNVGVNFRLTLRAFERASVWAEHLESPLHFENNVETWYKQSSRLFDRVT